MNHAKPVLAAALAATFVAVVAACDLFGASECVVDSDCSGDEVCIDSACQSGCANDDDCDRGERCNASGECVGGNEGEGAAAEGEGAGGEGEGAGGEGEGAGGEGEGAGGEGEGEGEGGGVETQCDDNVDNEGDGFTDCEDFDCTGDVACGPVAARIQDVQDGIVPLGSAARVVGVVVTAHAVNAVNGNHTLFVQEAEGVTTAFHVYPEFAGVSVFVQSAQVATFSDVTSFVVGDCVTVGGNVDEFHGSTQLDFVTELHFESGCFSGAPVPHVVAVTDLQPTSFGETFEGVLVTITGVEASEASINGDFHVDDFAGTQLLISSFLMTTDPVVNAFDQFSSITGVFSEFDDFRIQPREDFDLVRQ